MARERSVSDVCEVLQCSRQRTGSQYKCVQNLLRARAAFFANVIT